MFRILRRHPYSNFVIFKKTFKELAHAHEKVSSLRQEMSYCQMWENEKTINRKGATAQSFNVFKFQASICVEDSWPPG